jgi:RNA polymerase sigma factor (TIGR02999 family)
MTEVKPPHHADRPKEGTASEVTQLLAQWASAGASAGKNAGENKGDNEHLNKLFALVYEELKRLAQHHLRMERDNHTLQRTALVHEAFMRLVDQREGVSNRALFFSLASRVMRRVLIDHARGRLASKRGAGAPMISLDQTQTGIDGQTHIPFEISGEGLQGAESLAQFAQSEERSAQMLSIDRALQRLEAIDEQQAKVVELRFFGGLSIEETAATLGISVATVKRDWTVARLWLKRELVQTGDEISEILI